MNIKQRIAQRNLKEAFTYQGHETKPYDTQATVTKLEEDIAWVHIPGGISETPVQRTIDAKAGDTVTLRVSGGSAWITGNLSSPPTDDTAANDANDNAKDAKVTAVQAQGTADGAKTLAGKAGSAAENAVSAAGTAGTAAKQAAAQADQAKVAASNAQTAATNVNIKFSSLIRKTDDGIECGMVPDSSSLADGNSVTVPVALVNTDGSFDVNLVIYTNASGTVSRTKTVRFASFGTEAVIGEIDQTHARIDNDSFDIIDADGSIRASLGGSTPMLQIGAFTFINRENGNLTLRLN